MTTTTLEDDLANIKLAIDNSFSEWGHDNATLESFNRISARLKQDEANRLPELPEGWSYMDLKCDEGGWHCSITNYRKFYCGHSTATPNLSVLNAISKIKKEGE